MGVIGELGLELGAHDVTETLPLSDETIRAHLFDVRLEIQSAAETTGPDRLIAPPFLRTGYTMLAPTIGEQFQAQTLTMPAFEPGHTLAPPSSIFNLDQYLTQDSTLEAGHTLYAPSQIQLNVRFLTMGSTLATGYNMFAPVAIFNLDQYLTQSATLETGYTINAPTVSHAAGTQYLTLPVFGPGHTIAAPVSLGIFDSAAPSSVSATVSAASTRMGFTVTLPTDPTVGSPVVCTTAGQVTTALGSNNQHIQIDGDMTGQTFNIPTGRDDIYITGSTENAGSWYINEQSNRIKFENIKLEGVFGYYPSSDANMQTDLQFIDVVGVTDGHNANQSFLELRGKRVLISGCRTDAIIGRYALWMDGGPTQSTDVLLWDNFFEVDGAESCVRIVSANRVAVARNIFKSGMKHCQRYHSDSLTYPGQNIWSGYNHLENRGIMMAALGTSFDHVEDVMIEEHYTIMRDNGRTGVNSLMDLGMTYGNISNFQFLNNHAVTDDFYSYPYFESQAPSQDNWTAAGSTGSTLEGTPL